ncbi:TauD/TfdA family dioxygenase [Streptomyces sp. NPDC050509]|uniref:TauD/TfdA family dioxygenase n=1 Tax=Streptomyces sp. NPDC050509 TaxID=3365620 RepID=UPI003790FEEF
MTELVPAGGGLLWDGESLREDDWLVRLPWYGGGVTDRAGRDALEDVATYVDRRLREGPGFAVVRGVELEGLTDAECVESARRFGGLLGTVRPCGEATDELVTADARARGQVPVPDQDRDDRALPPHMDRSPQQEPPRVLGLLCVRPATSGGESMLVSGAAVHDRLLAEQPALLRHLYEKVHFGRGDGFERFFPVFRRRSGGSSTSDALEVFYNRHHIERGRREAGVALSAEYLAALEAFDGVLADPRMALRIPLRRGDFLLVCNKAVLHGRTAFTDPHEPLRHRLLVRMWAD